MTNSIMVEYEEKGNCFIARLKLEANTFLTDQAYLAAFREVLENFERKSGFDRVVLNLKEMAYMQSMAISGLLRLQSQLKERGAELKLAEMGEDVNKVLAIMNLDKHFSIFDTEAAALE